jgi:hypothetical protein
MLKIHQVDPNAVKTVDWEGDPIKYDLNLKQLGNDLNEFLIPNPNLVVDLSQIIRKIPVTNRCIVWKCEGEWIAKRFIKSWTPRHGYLDIEVPVNSLKISQIWTKNPDLDPKMDFEDNPWKNYAPVLTDCYYELVWYMDKRFLPGTDRVWVMKCTPADGKSLGVKDMGSLTPKVKIEYNPELPNMNLDIDQLLPPYYDLGHECAYMLDKKHAPFDDVWVVKFFPEYKLPEPLIWLGTVTPEFEVVQNPHLPPMSYDVDYDIPWRDFKYEHMWMLDSKHCENAVEDIWAFKIITTDNPQGVKVMGGVSPNLSIEYNPRLPEMNYDVNDYVIQYHDLCYEHMWMLDKKHSLDLQEEIWIFKIKATDELSGLKIVDYLSPKIEIEFNPTLPKLKYDLKYDIQYYDFYYEHVWLLDSKHTMNLEEDIWTFKIKAVKNTQGVKIVGPISPKLTYRYNPELPKLNYEINYDFQYHDLDYEHVWLLDSRHCENAPEEIYAVKVSAVSKPIGFKVIGEISPSMTYEINPDLEGYMFEEPHLIAPYHDLGYQYVWMLDKNYSREFDIWAVKGRYTNKPVGDKLLNFIEPAHKIVYNKDVKDLRISINYKIPYHDREYEHVWYLDEKFTSGQKIWAAKMTACPEPTGEKEMGIVTPMLPDYLDVVFISYNEKNAELNWARVLEKAPWAKRVNGVKGIFEAHKAAAELSNTDMFYVVDGDAYLVDDWKFTYQPSLFDRDCAYVWSSKNPINDLTYGYGGVKLFSKKRMLRTKSWKTLDMTTGIMPKLKILNKVSCVTAFNTDEFSTWKSAFRECIKLHSNLKKDPDNQEHKDRLEAWQTIGKERVFGEYALAGALEAKKFFNKEKGDTASLMKINNIDWLRKKFDTIYSKKK